ncbi:hypothetical protein [Amantichitinum ursilacus]|uniref:Uncharacterized protein n=1 Tax=Amantichitinum ursilacus TaxID=857265 RepID=A0A0N1JSC4_9NEIS|nr:hypothetical protein [Amantichitinum ursilacus]KPC52303.1 hypothetical protein WG78_14630 [Amantichitinum ursilacus]
MPIQLSPEHIRLLVRALDEASSIALPNEVFDSKDREALSRLAVLFRDLIPDYYMLDSE